MQLLQVFLEDEPPRGCRAARRSRRRSTCKRCCAAWCARSTRSARAGPP